MFKLVKRIEEKEENAPKRKTRERDEDSLEVTVDDSGIYFYTEVSKESVLNLNKNLKEMSLDLLHTANVLEIPVPEIKLHINSPGGSLFDGLSAVDYIRKCKVPVHSIIEGAAASAATLISVMAHRRSINKHSYMLIHQLSSASFGKYEELVDDMENNNKLMDAIKNIYLSKTKIPEKILKDILKRDIYFDSKECLKYGLVDKIND
jgi:ATP-dependent protease ClpP protease subunit